MNTLLLRFCVKMPCFKFMAHLQGSPSCIAVHSAETFNQRNLPVTTPDCMRFAACRARALLHEAAAALQGPKDAQKKE